MVWKLQGNLNFWNHECVCTDPNYKITSKVLKLLHLEERLRNAWMYDTPFILIKNAAQPPEDVPCLPLVHCRYKRSRDWGKTLPGQRTSTNTAQTRRECRARPSSTNTAQPPEDVPCLPLSTVDLNARGIRTGNTSLKSVHPFSTRARIHLYQFISSLIIHV